MKISNCFAGLATVAGIAMTAQVAHADMLDDIIADGELKCGVMLDVPPVGMRDNDNNPIGFDVEFCKDMAAALGVEAVIVETPAPDRIPAILSGRVHIGVASATNSLERAKSVAFSIPYQIWDVGIAIAADNTDITSDADLAGKSVGTVRGTTGEVAFLDAYEKGLKDSGTTYTSFSTNSEQFLALQQGKVDAIVEATTIFGEYVKGAGAGEIRVCCTLASAPADWTGLMVKRDEQGFLNWVNLFVWHEWKNGRTNELYNAWFGYDAPSMAFPGVHGY
ncbi:transporter substrate-binding domain-containing protein [Defluviimonas sp. WL0024]|uniref:Transporter substrate-binding domain-containing protein n=1 Tax=Albidovulum salinarum TaxID=2984153 RepID=A0ABT2X8S4_9RHOB|nr:transporter substrate-binding domain-containing protein [Defluviimonas sp. WL0024]MCU9850349.1 transporter substrate-binding domain-containing protein [Defluviimonas sp. WL0024]